MRAGLNEFDRRHNYVNIDFIEPLIPQRKIF